MVALSVTVTSLRAAGPRPSIPCVFCYCTRKRKNSIGQKVSLQTPPSQKACQVVAPPPEAQDHTHRVFKSPPLGWTCDFLLLPSSASPLGAVKSHGNTLLIQPGLLVRLDLAYFVDDETHYWAPQTYHLGVELGRVEYFFLRLVGSHSPSYLPTPPPPHLT